MKPSCFVSDLIALLGGLPIGDREMKFKSTQVTDLRGKHWCVFEDSERKTVCARDFNKENIDKLLSMFNSGQIKPNFEARCIGIDAEMHLTA